MYPLYDNYIFMKNENKLFILKMNLYTYKIFIVINLIVIQKSMILLI